MSQRTLRVLLAFYPRAWRERYGEEFAQLLDDLGADEPRSALRNVLDVIRNVAPVQAVWHPVLSSLLVFFVSGGVAIFAITAQQARQAAIAVVQNNPGQVLIIQSHHKTYVSRDFTKRGTGSSQTLTVRASALGHHKKMTFVCREVNCNKSTSP